MPWRSLTLIFLGIVLLAACSPQQSQAGTETFIMPDDRPTKIVMLGDSLTAGYGLRRRDALPNVVERHLTEAGWDATLINSGISGDTTGGALARYAESVSDHQPDVLVILLGTNDFLSGISAARARQNLERIISRAQGNDIHVVLVGIRPRFTEVPQAIQDEYTGMFESLAADRNLSFHPDLMEGVWHNADLMMIDGLHPTADGVEVMGERLSDMLKTILRNTPAADD